MFDRRWLLASGLALVGILRGTFPATAGFLDASWTAPTMDADGNPLTDLGFYRLYFGTSGSPCPSGTSVQVASPTSSPQPTDPPLSVRLTGLTTTGATVASVAAVDTSGNQGPCSSTFSAVANASFTVSPITISFGNVNIGSFADQSVTVQSTRPGVTGTASVSAPFTIVSGSPFTLGTAGATATITVRFTPTSTGPTSTNVTFSADGETPSRLVSGTGVATSSTLTVTKAGAGSGTVTSNPAGISCGTTCSAPYASGTVVTLTAIPATGSVFTGWSGGDCSGTGTTCSVTLSAAATVTATFALQTFTLTVSKSGTGIGTVTSAPAGASCGAMCVAAFPSGTAVTLTATPAGGSTFTGWSGGHCSGTGTCSITLSAAATVTATFAPTLVLTVSKEGAGTGTVTSTPAGITCGTTCLASSASYVNGTVVTLTATPAKGSVFTGWSDGGCSGTGTCSVTLNAATTVTATFALQTRKQVGRRDRRGH